MNKIRQTYLNEKFKNVDEETKKIFILAEDICRREYEKAFNLNLDLSIGHPQNLISFSNKKERKQQLNKIISFWEDLKERYFKNCSEPLASAVAYFCDIQEIGMMKLMS